MLSIKLDKEIPCDYICNSMQKLIDEYRKNVNTDLSNAILVIDIKTIIDTDNPMLLLNYNSVDQTQ